MMHYKLTTESKVNIQGKVLFRIEAIIDFKYARKGEKGGWVEKESNLSDNAWVSDNAEVSGNARVSGDARVFDNARVFGNAMVSDNAKVFGNAWVYGYATVFGNAWVYGDTRVYGDAEVYGDALVYGDARVLGDAEVYGDARVFSNAEVSGNAQVSSMVFTLNFIYQLTLTDYHINYGCIQKTITEWIEWLNSDEVIETKRDDPKFKIIEMALRLAIEYRNQNRI